MRITEHMIFFFPKRILMAYPLAAALSSGRGRSLKGPNLVSKSDADV
jgi:hypothetical protein